MRYVPCMQSDSRFQVPGITAGLSRAIAGDLRETPIAEVAMSVRAPHGSGFFLRDNAGNLLEFCEQRDLFAD